MRKCSTCKSEKEESEFYKDKSEKDGIEKRCKNCQSQRQKTFKIQNPTKWEERMERGRAQFRLKKTNGASSERIRRRRGTGTIDKKGYLIISKKGHPNAYGKGHDIPEHRYIMSKHLGRPLYKEENVHHKNGVKTDNRLENLELWSKSHPCGQRVQDKIEWCVNFLKQYGYEVIKS